MSLDDGERQVAPTLDGIRSDHLSRYVWAVNALMRHFPQSARAVRVLDLACGVGYGSHILATAGYQVVGVDRSAEALRYAVDHYGGEGVTYQAADANDPLSWAGDFDAVVCFETLEHLEDPLPVLRAMREAAPLLLVSVPNEDVFPHGGKVKHHFRHYRPAELRALLEVAGYRVEAWYGQEGPESEVEPERVGRTIIAVARRAAVVASVKVPRPAVVPDHVAIVGLGPSCTQFFELTRRLGGVSKYCDEVWGINAIGDVLRCDRVFHMDDLRVQEARAAARPDSNIAAMVQWLKRHPGPVYTSVVRDGYPGLVAFPLQDVLNGSYDTSGGAPYFNSTAAYAIAFAVHIGVKKISLYGIDYTFPNAHQAEKGRACCEFWLGIAAARGIELQVPEGTPLLDACEPDELRLYGYDCVDVKFHDRADGGVEISMHEKAAVPTAAEIEARYDHKQHPNPLVRKAGGAK